ncbi:MAG: hypothetical protein D6760_02090 [Deltaproteobacteria bacterium]|nr:MAG: hypothetical protein D6760_02090 [Deltaproteobacteria bacterium]
MSPTSNRSRHLEVVAQSKRGMIDAVRQALLGAHRRLGSLDCCEAELLSQIVRKGRTRSYEITLSVTQRPLRQTHGS